MDVGRSIRAAIERRRQRRNEGEFLLAMRSAARVLTLAEFEEHLDRAAGTAIDETLSLDGRWRLWWTPDDIPALSPHPVPTGEWVNIVADPQFEPFFAWCLANYTSPASGRALLVDLPVADRRRIVERVARSRRIATVSGL